jgi:hypothetical protein
LLTQGKDDNEAGRKKDKQETANLSDREYLQNRVGYKRSGYRLLLHEPLQKTILPDTPRTVVDNCNTNLA